MDAEERRQTLSVLEDRPNNRKPFPCKRLYFSVSVATLAIALTACGPEARQTEDAAANDAATVVADAGNATENAVEAATDALTPAPKGQEFVDRAEKSDAFEITAAWFAQSNTTSAEVKTSATEMTKPHTDPTTKIKEAAAQATPAITPQPTLTDDQNDELAELGKLKGAEFDQQYMSGQVEAHDDALALMESYARNGDMASIKTAATKIAPIVQRHLEMARKLSR